MKVIFALIVALLCPALAQAGDSTPPAGARITLKVADLSPKFLAFYTAAQQEQASPERRWELWQTLYGFAAVPPTPEGERMARSLLDGAWQRYPEALPRIRPGAAGMAPPPQATMDAVARLLRPDRPAEVRLLAFVGGFDHNAFTAAQDGRITVAIPVEMESAERERIMAHEFTHAVQIAMGSFAGGWERSIGATVLTEGLASRASAHLFPGQPAAQFIEMTPGWLERAAGRRRAILEGIRPHLQSATSEDVSRFTIGAGATGLEREAYYAGWEVVGYWLEQGMGFAEIARIPESEMPARVGAAIDSILARP